MKYLRSFHLLLCHKALFFTLALLLIFSLNLWAEPQEKLSLLIIPVKVTSLKEAESLQQQF